LGVGRGANKTHPVKKLIVTKVEQRKKLDRLIDDGRKKTRYLGVRRWRELMADRRKWKDNV
jgi:hypothetical protein